MLIFLRKVFNSLSRIDKFLGEKRACSFNGALIVIILIFVIGAIGTIIKEYADNDVVIRISAFMMGSYLYLLLPYGYFKNSRLKKYIVFGEKRTYEEILKSYSNYSYFVFLLFFSYVAMIPEVGIPIMFNLFGINIISEFILDNLLNCLYFNVLFGSIIWFSYHIIKAQVSLQKIKIKVTQYTACGTTISFFLNLMKLGNFSLMLSGLLISYLWIQYLIELKSDE